MTTQVNLDNVHSYEMFNPSFCKIQKELDFVKRQEENLRASLLAERTKMFKSKSNLVGGKSRTDLNKKT